MDGRPFSLSPTDLDHVVSAASSPRSSSAASAGAPSGESAPPASPRTFALLDALDVLDQFPLAPPVATARQFLDRVANIRIDDDGIVLTGVWPRRIAWEDIESVETCSRLEGLLQLGLGFTPLGRIPKVADVAESTLVGTLERIAPGPLAWARQRAGWTVVRIHRRTGTTELRRLPALVARLYPETTEVIVAVARARGIEVTRNGTSEERA